MKSLWTEKYRPTDLDTYVFKDPDQRKVVEQWIASGIIPHLLFSGAPGTGKTTLAKILVQALGVIAVDVLEINASRENSVDVIRNKITGFVETMPFGAFKVVLLDECDYMTPNGQAALRGVMEMYAEQARFILTCNYPHKVIPALHSRCQGFHIERLDQNEFTARAAQILIEEGVQFDIDNLDTYVKSTYPDLRKCINTLQQHSVGGQLASTAEVDGTQDWKIAAIELIKGGNIRRARELITRQAGKDEMEEVFRWMYDNLALWGKDDNQKDEAVLIIRKGLVNHGLVADPEINLSATLIELSQI